MATKKEKTKKTKTAPKKGALREMTTPELTKLIEDSKKELFELRVKIKMASHPQVRQVRDAKKTIARIMTILHEREKVAVTK